ncbi:putative transmembrane transcriptional regulator (anti-sigma factor) [Luteitalea pratensis]|uniref:Putative transmembrane transcriptional regulator (Anti-sigma factor) n=1 Tax=Luteitalea pratensis TaxID=1855912 RepID=A0A143PT54_LUTPR|nr:anti-sigma factor [Luteitalea pratensis]AMY11516.1 putative transmembrane transcriptional regulator (anti-sigma factor) [Luteitalea pratensis]
MKCQDIQQALDAQLVGTLGRADAEALDAHLATCPECEAMVADARRLQAELRLIGVEGPSPRVWERVSARLEADPEFERAAAAAVDAAPRSSRIDWRWAALAATLLMVIAGSLLVLRRSLTTATPPAPAVAAAPADAGSDAIVSSIESELDLAAKHYENAIAGLERVASESDSPIDPTVMATVKENLEIIDQAIDDSRQALRTDPQSQLAQESLFDAFRRKVALLQDTISLMNEMRKGNPTRATAIAPGLNKG